MVYEISRETVKRQVCVGMLQSAGLVNSVSYAGKGLRKPCADGRLHIFIPTEPLPQHCQCFWQHLIKVFNLSSVLQEKQ